MLSVPRVMRSEIPPRVGNFGRLKLIKKSKHPALKALTYFANRVQDLGYPFSRSERVLYNIGVSSVSRQGRFICPQCLKPMSLMSINAEQKIWAWFCDCSYPKEKNEVLR